MALEEEPQSPGYRNTLEALLVRVMAELDDMERRMAAWQAESDGRQAEAAARAGEAAAALAESLEIQGDLVEAAGAAAARLGLSERKASRRAAWAACAACLLAGCLAGLWLGMPR